VTPTGKEILKDISVGMYLGAKIGVLGANGSGKSSLMRILAGVDKAFDGDYHLENGIKSRVPGAGQPAPRVHLGTVLLCSLATVLLCCIAVGDGVPGLLEGGLPKE